MKKLRNILYLMLALSSIGKVAAQQDFLVSQYNFNALMLNPAYAGAHKYNQASTTYRNQWSIEGAPTTQVVCMDGSLIKAPIGIGFVMTSDKIGVVKERTLNADLSYKFRTRLGKMSFGLRGGYVNYRAALDELVYWDEDDPIYQAGNPSQGFLTLGFGAFFSSSSEKWFAGVSSPAYYAKDQELRSTTEDRFYKRHYYIYGGGVISTDFGIDLKPSAMIRIMEQTPILIDFNLHALVYGDESSAQPSIWIGGGFRTNKSFVASLEAMLPYNLRVGYSYDLIGNELYQYLGATHEIQIGFNFGGKNVVIQSPRYF